MEKDYSIAYIAFFAILIISFAIWFYTLRNETVAEKAYVDFYKENKGKIKVTGSINTFRDVYYSYSDDPKKDNDHIQDVFQSCHNAIYGNPTKLGCHGLWNSMSLNNIIKNFFEPDKYDTHKYYLWCLLDELDEKYCFCHTNAWVRACKWYTRKN